MSIELLGIGGINQINNLKKNNQSSSTQKAEAGKSDTVEFSSVLQDVNKAKTAPQSHNADRAERIAQLKAQVAEGSYNPDPEKVASSLLQFLLERRS